MESNKWEDLASLPYEKPAEKVSGLTKEIFAEWVERAAAMDWEGHALMARKYGVFSPVDFEEPEEVAAGQKSAMWSMSSFSHGSMDAFTLGFYRAGEKEEGSAWMESFLAWAPKVLGKKVVQTWFEGECLGFGSSARSHHSSWARQLIKWGAEPSSELALAAIESAQPLLLKEMLAAGLDPNSKPKGEMPLLVAALHKDRCVSSSEKMRCAAMLWNAGADLERWFDKKAEPCCLLMLADMADKRSLPDGHWGVEYVFNWNYWDECGMGPEALIPPKSAPEARSRMAKWLDNGADKSSYPWLLAALELCALDSKSKTAASGKKKSL